MINSLVLISIIGGISMQSIMQKEFDKKVKVNGVFLFSALSGIFAMLFFLATSRKLEFASEFIPYSAAFGISYSVSMIFSFLAIACGSLSLTALITSFSLMLPTFYGLLFLDEPIGAGFVPGLILLIVSLILINGKVENVRVTPKWVLYITLSFLGNGMCSVFQKMQQVAFDGGYKNEFMIVALLIVSVTMTMCTLFSEKRNIAVCIKKGWYYGLVWGLANGMVNLFVMVLSAKMPVSVMFPLISAGELVLTFFVSRYLYKEGLSKKQLVGFVFGILSVIFLNV